MKAHRALDRYRPDQAPFRTWLLAIVANEARNDRRAAGRRRRHELGLVADRPVGPPSPADEAEAAEGRRALLGAVLALPERQRDVVGCRYLLELSEAETAAVLGLSPGTVKSHLSRALTRLRQEVLDRG